MSKRVAILGGGVAGVVAARYLAEVGGVEVDLHEKSDRLGGLHASHLCGGRQFDVGAFAFSADDTIFKAFPMLRDRYVRFQPSFRCLLDGGYLEELPPRIWSFANRVGCLNLLKAGAELLYAKISDRRRDSVPAFCRYYLGRSFYVESGLKTYIERLFGRPDDQIDVRFAQQRLEHIAAGASVRALASRLLRHVERPRSEKIAFARPRCGFADAYDFIERELRRQGVTVHKSSKLQSLNKVSTGFELIGDRETWQYDNIVSTIPIPALTSLLGYGVSSTFDTMQLVSLFYKFDGEAGYDCSYLYNFTSEGRWKRIVDFSVIYDEYACERWFSVEITRPAAEKADPDQEYAAFESHVRSVGLFRGALSRQGFAVTRNAYPIFDAGGEPARERERERILGLGIQIAGRQGRFAHIGSEVVATSGREAAQRLLQ